MATPDVASNAGALPRMRDIVRRVRRVRSIHLSWSAERDKLWVGTIAVPLAMTATGLLSQWWAWPLLLVVAAATTSWRWDWLLSFEMAFVSTAWAYVGASSFATWPTLLLPIALAWIAFPCVLGTVSYRQRHAPT